MDAQSATTGKEHAVGVGAGEVAACGRPLADARAGRRANAGLGGALESGGERGSPRRRAPPRRRRPRPPQQ